jgi:hypothetical protein
MRASRFDTWLCVLEPYDGEAAAAIEAAYEARVMTTGEALDAIAEALDEHDNDAAAYARMAARDLP